MEASPHEGSRLSEILTRSTPALRNPNERISTNDTLQGRITQYYYVPPPYCPSDTIAPEYVCGNIWYYSLWYSGTDSCSYWLDGRPGAECLDGRPGAECPGKSLSLWKGRGEYKDCFSKLVVTWEITPFEIKKSSLGVYSYDWKNRIKPIQFFLSQADSCVTEWNR